jgi:tRNA threonylcarbamoyladenosine biosynthesis protein TsaE
MKETFLIRGEDVANLADKVVEMLAEDLTPKAKVVLLEGDLGAGKTTFTKEIAHVLGIDKGDVQSPTFILKKEYQTSHSSFRKLIHIDAYRFNDKEEGRVLKVEDDMKDSTTIIAIEWPSKMEAPVADLSIVFTIVDDETREVTLMYE